MAVYRRVSDPNQESYSKSMVAIYVLQLTQLTGMEAQKIVYLLAYFQLQNP